MTLSTRTIIAVSATLIALVATIHVVTKRVVLDGFAAVERVQFERHAERGRQAMGAIGEELSGRLSDWANWDDCYAFAEDGNDSFVQSNITGNALSNLSLRFILWVSPEGDIAHSAARIPGTEELGPLPEGLERAVDARPAFFTVAEEDGGHVGFLWLPEGLVSVAVRPILNSMAEGPARGSLVFAQPVDPGTVDELSEKLRARVSVRHTDSVDEIARSRVEPLLRSDAPTERAGVTPLDEHLAVGSLLLADIDGTPNIFVEVASPRHVWREAQATVSFILIALAAAGTGAVVAISLVLRRVVLRRLGQLHADVATIRASGDLARRVRIEGNDELAELGQTVNAFVERVDTSQRELREKAETLARLTEALRVARDAAERANRAKSAFLANMSHEVRTPMTAILGYADLLAETQRDGDTGEAVDTIRRNATHLLALINDILDLSKIEAGRMEIERIDCSPVEVANQAIDLLRESASRKGLMLSLELATPIPERVQSDPTRLRQILLNLAGNAIKFTRTGSVTVRLACDATACTLTAEVADTGVGMTEEQAQRLFRPFTQADLSTARTFGGTGLGLSISKQLARLLGGDLVVAATGPGGSTFRLTVETGPLDGVSLLTSQRVTSKAPPARVAAGTHGELGGRRLLLAEDGPDNQRLLGFLLRRAGATVTIVGDGQAAVDAAFEADRAGKPFDLILMDMQMPILDGFGAVRELRRRGWRRPIVALTAQAMEGDRARCLDAGCDDYETKPVDKRRLFETCARLTDAVGRLAA